MTCDDDFLGTRQRLLDELEDFLEDRPVSEHSTLSKEATQRPGT